MKLRTVKKGNIIKVLKELFSLTLPIFFIQAMRIHTICILKYIVIFFAFFHKY
jgi:hypothetical protein